MIAENGLATFYLNLRYVRLNFILGDGLVSS